MPQNGGTQLMAATEHTIGTGGRYQQNTRLDGLLAEMHVLDGQLLLPTAFAETGVYGEWKPIDCKDDLTYGDNGFYLDFKSSGVGTASSSTVGADRSGNDNHFASSNIAATDQMLDSPTNNFATYNPLHRRAALTNPTYSEGNLKIVHPNLSGNASYGVSSIGVDSGKYYCEILALDVATAFSIGIATRLQWNGDGNRNSYISYKNGGDIKKYTNVSSAEATYTDDDIIAIAFDIDNKTVAFYKNNALQHTVTDIDAGFEDTYHLLIQASTNDTHVANFGQDSSFAGNKTAQGNSDVNSIGDFFYTPPSGFLAMCTKNLATSVIVPSQHFNTLLYTGNDADGSTAQAISGVGFQPDFVWIKNREIATENHQLFDVVRGVGQRIFSDDASAEDDRGAFGLRTFDSDGFTVGQGDEVNDNSVGHVSWNWKAGSANTAFSESGNNPAGTHRANVDAGFSIVSYTGTGAAGTVAHGLGVAPELMIIKNRDVGDAWAVYYGDNTDYMVLDTTAATADAATYFNDTSPSATVFTVNTAHSVNADGEKYIAYCWRSIDGFSKIGAYTGNGAVDGTFVHTGFRPAWIMIKRVDIGDAWAILDNKRDDINPADDVIKAEDPAAEAANQYAKTDFVSNGFKLRALGSTVNNSSSGDNYIYLAFAETPFKNSNAR